MGLLRMAARTAVVAGTATAVSGRVANKQAARQQAAQPAAAPAEAAAPEPSGATDVTDQLTQLAALHAQGILSDEEFSAAKKKALGI